MQWGAVNRIMISMLKVLLRLGITKIINLFSALLSDFRKQEDMSSSGTTETGDAAVVGMLDVALLTGSVLIVIAIILRCRRKSINDENSRLKDLKINASAIGRAVSIGDDPLGGNFLDKMKSRNKKVVVFYGSQTGTAEEFASRLAKDATRHGLPAMTFDPEDCTDWEDLQKLGNEIENSLAIFCVATYGEGDPTDNAQELNNWIEDADLDLSGLNYTVFGLGNKTYEHFNAMGRLLDKRLAQLGANRLYKQGEGDDDACIEEDFVTWSEDLWPVVCQQFDIDNTEQVNVAREYELKVMSDVPAEKVYAGEPHRLGSYQNQKPPYNAKNPFLAPMKVNRELHNGGDRSCMHIEMDITGSRLNYVAGDHVAIFPVNDVEKVEKIGKLLNTDLDTVISLTNVDDQASKKHPFPCPTTYRTALSHYVDITSCPHTNVLRELAEFASDPTHREFLLKMTAPTEEGKHEYSEWIMRDKRTIVAVLEDLPSFKPPLDYLLELLPRLHARYYSISSSPKVHPSSIHITAILVEYETKTGRTNSGVTTSWLKRLQQQTANGAPEIRIPVFVRHSSLRLPYRNTSPVIMVGPGTGVAPFRGFIQDRSVVKDKGQGKQGGDTILYFGCRHKAEDYLYGDEFEDYKEKGVLSDLHVAFSRDQETKVYVQDKMAETGESIWKLLEKQGYFYVCGDARNMARDVHNTLIDIVEKYGKMETVAATEYIKKLQKRGRYLQDVWT